MSIRQLQSDLSNVCIISLLLLLVSRILASLRGIILEANLQENDAPTLRPAWPTPL